MRKSTETATTDEKVEVERKIFQFKLFVSDEYPTANFQVAKQGYNVQGFTRDEDTDVQS